MAKSLGSFATDMIRALGGSPTPQAKRLFSAWQRWEGGWTHNDATYNPLNLTAPGSGLPTINSVGVVAIPTYQQGVMRTAELIRKGYPALAAAFRSGKVDFTNPAFQGDLNRWLSGKRTPAMTPYVRKIAGSYGQNVPAGQVPRAQPQPAQPQLQNQPQIQQPRRMRRVFDPGKMGAGILSQFAAGGNIDFSILPSLVAQSWTNVPDSPLKKVPTAVVQKRGVVDPDGDLKDPPVANAHPLLAAAAKQIGRPYVWGGESRAEGGFDCSGLIYWAYNQIGINIGRTTYDQINDGRNVTGQKLQPGDLIFPHKGHVVMYVGNGKVIAAPYTGTVVQYQPVSKFANPIAVRRVLPNVRRGRR